jgi:hypothetical protein
MMCKLLSSRGLSLTGQAAQQLRELVKVIRAVPQSLPARARRRDVIGARQRDSFGTRKPAEIGAQRLAGGAVSL